MVHYPLLRAGNNNSSNNFGRLLIRCFRCGSIASSSTTTSTRRFFGHVDVDIDPSYVDNSTNSPIDFDPNCAVVYPNFITKQEGELLSTNILSRLKRRRYERGHWDAVITNYKEMELSDDIFLLNNDNDDDETKKIPQIFGRIRQHLEDYHLNNYNDNDIKTTKQQQQQQQQKGVAVNWLPCHAIDLKKDGELNAHVDSIKFSGNLVSGISLLSPSIMRLVPDINNDNNDDDDDNNKADEASSSKSKDETNNKEGGWVDLYLPPLSLYVMTGVARYKYSHQLLPTNSTFRFIKKGGTTTTETEEEEEIIVVERDHRLSIIFRDAKE